MDRSVLCGGGGGGVGGYREGRKSGSEKKLFHRQVRASQRKASRTGRVIY